MCRVRPARVSGAAGARTCAPRSTHAQGSGRAGARLQDQAVRQVHAHGHGAEPGRRGALVALAQRGRAQRRALRGRGGARARARHRRPVLGREVVEVVARRRALGRAARRTLPPRTRAASTVQKARCTKSNRRNAPVALHSRLKCAAAGVSSHCRLWQREAPPAPQARLPACAHGGSVRSCGRACTCSQTRGSTDWPHAGMPGARVSLHRQTLQGEQPGGAQSAHVQAGGMRAPLRRLSSLRCLARKHMHRAP
jgi:hypothetical protein